MPTRKNLKILVVGGGSIGVRHLKNLKALGIKELAVFDLDQKKLKEIGKKFRVQTFRDLKTALKREWSAVFVCTPPSIHIGIALMALEKKTPLFIEKPLSHNLQNTQKLINKIRKYKIPAMVGYNLNFHPYFQRIREMLKNGLLGKVWGVRAEFGQYLPDWHPWEDYQKGYSAQKRLGGGIVLDDIHEIDCFYGLFGRVKKTFAFAGKISNLKIDTEDYAEIILWFESGVIGEIHMDYLQRDYSRNLKIIGEKGTILWDLKTKTLSWYLDSQKKWQSHCLKNFDNNQPYLEEVKHFLNCLEKGAKPEPGIERGCQTLKIALSVKKSAKLNKIMTL